MRSDRFRELVSKNPDNELFRFSLGQALADEGNHAEAADAFRFCAERKSDWMMARILLGKSLLALNRKVEAVQALKEALALAVEQNHEDPEQELRALLADLD